VLGTLRRGVAAVACVVALGLVPAARADAPFPPEAPLLHAQLTPGDLVFGDPVTTAVAPKVVDGDVSDWVGTPSGYGGTTVRSNGELIYTDHLFDAYGADNGDDADRLALLHPLADAVPETYRLDALYKEDPAGQVIDTEGTPLASEEQYGDLDHVDAADLREVRLASDGSSLFVLVRTTTMVAGAEPTILIEVDGVRHLIVPGDPSAAYNADGYTNAVEVSLPLTNATPRVAVAAGTGTGDAFVPANVAFRTEPVRTWWDEQQALALHAGTLEPFTITVDVAALAAGITDSWRPGAGYFDRIFESTTANISTEGGQDGIWQHYGVYLPEHYDGVTPVPMTVWLHWRGGKAHSAASVAPRVFRDFGEGRNGIVIAPRGRGTSTWWIGEGMADFLEVWDDALATYQVDRSRVAVAGHSMGGNGSYVLSVLMPDRFAAALPVEGPVTQGAWTGLDFDGCDDLAYEEYTPCYVQTNEGDARVQHIRGLLENLRNTPIAIFQGAIDELVPVTGTTREVEWLVQLGYRHRYYVFPTYEHFTHPVVDEWMELVRYADAQQRPDVPARVTFVRNMPFERRVSQGADASRPPVLNFAFDSAWWMSGLTPADTDDGVASFDGRTFAVADEHLVVPEAGGPAALGQAGPYAMTGLAWLPNPLASPSTANGFEITVIGARAVTLDLAAMGLDTTAPIAGRVTTDTPVEVRLLHPDGTVTVLTIDTGTREVDIP
jgi:predicted esterase